MKKCTTRRHRPFETPGLWVIMILLQVLFVCPGHAEEEEKEEKEAVQLDDITVMAAQPGVEITPDKTIIRMDEFVKPGDVRTLTDVLKTMGGIDVMRINPMMASPGDEVSIRGMNEGRLVIEIDGRRINHTGHYGRYIVEVKTRIFIGSIPATFKTSSPSETGGASRRASAITMWIWTPTMPSSARDGPWLARKRPMTASIPA
ncbi:MAG: TonB-dependent receptor plug domain-containing protein [Deltaproteobacteria bacterium]|nr:TonB-dependent receptor plug domain-containing protein [Deltaproteobacteria bacterium]